MIPHPFDRRQNSVKNKRQRLVPAIAVGVIHAFGYNSLFYMFREAIRVMTIDEDYNLWVFSDAQVNFYNLFFAVIAVILGQSAGIAFFFDRPRRLFGWLGRRVNSIVLEQRNLNWVFLSWFSRICMFLGVFFGWGFQDGYELDIYRDFFTACILLWAVLFLHTWTTMRLVFRRRSLKGMLINMLLLTAIAFGMSRINLIDYHSVNTVLLKRNVFAHYTLEMPRSEWYERASARMISKNIYVAESTADTHSHGPNILIDSQVIPLDSLSGQIIAWRQRVLGGAIQPPAGLNALLTQRLIIHERIPMAFVKRLQDAASNAGLMQLDFGVLPDDLTYDKRYYDFFSMYLRIPDLSFSSSDEILEFYNNLDNNIKLQVDSVGNTMINDGYVPRRELKFTLSDSIRAHPDHLVKVYVDDSATYSDYIYVISQLRMVIDDLRNEYAELHFMKSYEMLDAQQKVNLREQYPFRMLTMTDTFIQAEQRLIK